MRGARRPQPRVPTGWRGRAWAAWRTGDLDSIQEDALAALDAWRGLPLRMVHDWMALWPLVAMAVDAGRIGEAAEHARGLLPPPQMLLAEPVRTMAENAVHAWDTRDAAETEQWLRQAVRAASDLGYL